MHFAGFIIGYALTYLCIKCGLIDKRVAIRYRHEAITAVRPGGYHDVMFAGQIKVLPLVGPEFSAANNNNNEVLFQCKYMKDYSK